jgi:cell division protein FtsW
MTAAVTVEPLRVRWRMGLEARALVLITAVLLVVGVATVYSTTAVLSQQRGQAPSYFLIRHLVGAAIGIVAFMLAAKIDADKYRRFAWHIMIGALTLMAAVLLTGKQFGSRRFLFGSGVQPSELAKIAVIIWTAALIVKKGDQLRRLTKGMMPFVVVIGLLAVLAFAEPDVSVALFYCAIVGAMLFVSGARVGHFLLLGCLAMPVAARKLDGYVERRIEAFRNPDAPQSQGTGLQTRQSLIAIGSGRLLGVGFGEGRQQSGFLPFQFTDFIGSAIGEEWGFVGLVLVIGLFSLYAWLGFRIARDARSPFLQAVAVGATLTTVVTAFIHLAVITGLFPNTGLTLPFISYGRTNLLVSLLLTGLLVNIGSTRERVFGEALPDPLLTTTIR